MNYQYLIFIKLEMDLKEINFYFNMYFIVLNINIEFVLLEYIFDIKKLNFIFYNKCLVCLCY